jgi:cytochrome c oxidase subunit I+III
LVLRMHGAAGLAPVRDAWSATVATLVAWQVFHAVVLVLMAGYAIARIAAGHVGPRSRATIDNVGLYWLGTMLQGALGVALVQLLPRLLG